MNQINLGVMNTQKLGELFLFLLRLENKLKYDLKR